mmetsp:Transcript_27495/g.42777  ORF Transcript_27495/g.42777 Transcript_27495/m.42777 type:complete len:259 (+) Transcript_27495:640-1416(+)
MHPGHLVLPCCRSIPLVRPTLFLVVTGVFICICIFTCLGLADKLLQVEGGGDGPALGQAGVAQVGHLAHDLLLHILQQRQPPQLVLLCPRNRLQLLRDRVVVAEHGGAVRSQSHAGRPSQGGAVDEQVRPAAVARLAGRHQRVRQYQPALRVRVGDFSCFSIAGGEHVSRAEGIARDGVLHGAYIDSEAHVQARGHDPARQPQHLGSTPHVFFHPQHELGRLDVQPASVKAHTLAHEGHCFCIFRPPLHFDESRRPLR